MYSPGREPRGRHIPSIRTHDGAEGPAGWAFENWTRSLGRGEEGAVRERVDGKITDSRWMISGDPCW